MSWKDEPATLSQRMAIERMYKRLGWDTRGIRDMTKQDAADAFSRCHSAFNERDQQVDTTGDLYGD